MVFGGSEWVVVFVFGFSFVVWVWDLWVVPWMVLWYNFSKVIVGVKGKGANFIPDAILLSTNIGAILELPLFIYLLLYIYIYIYVCIYLHVYKYLI